MSQQEELSKFETQNTVTESTTAAKVVDMTNVRKGLVNLGNTCYMNSFLQALYAMEEYREALLSMDEADFLQKDDAKPSIQAKVKLGIYQLQRLFA